MKKKKYTIEELKLKYWEFKKVMATRIVDYGGAYYGSSTRTEYPDTIEGFLLWLDSLGRL